MSPPHLCLYSPDEDLAACSPRQIQAVTQFKNEFDTHSCNNSDYSNEVWCNISTGEVTVLQLKACLSGSLKPNSGLFRFHHLCYLVLEENNFTNSPLPSEFGNLNKLELLDLSSCGFFGQIPSSFSNLTMLSALDLSDNQFSRTLNPNSSLFEMHHLFISVTTTSIPHSLPNLKISTSVELERSGHRIWSRSVGWIGNSTCHSFIQARVVRKDNLSEQGQKPLRPFQLEFDIM